MAEGYLLVIYISTVAAKDRPIMFRVTLLYQMIAHYELGNFEVLNSMLRNHKYFQKVNDAFYLIENLTHEFLNKTVLLKKKRERLAAKNIFEEQLSALSNKKEKTALVYLTNIGWVSFKKYE